MKIFEAVEKGILKIGDIIKISTLNYLFKVKKLKPNNDLVCHYADIREHEAMIKRGFTCVVLDSSEDYILCN